LLLMQFSFTYC